MQPLYLDNHLLALHKPAGQPTVPDASGDLSLLDAAREWIGATFHKPGHVYLGVVQRLDRPVSGVVVFARTSKAASRLAAQFREGSTEKRYLAIGEAHGPHAPVAGARGVLRQWLRKDRARNVLAASPRPATGHLEAVTAWEVLARVDDELLLALKPETGRPHQLRVGAASLGVPLLGDLKYGASRPLPDRSVALHAVAIRIEHPTRHEPVEIRAALPETPWWQQWRTTAESATTWPGTPLQEGTSDG